MAPVTGQKPKGDAQSLKRKREAGDREPRKTVEDSVSFSRIAKSSPTLASRTDSFQEPQNCKDISSRRSGIPPRWRECLDSSRAQTNPD